MLAKLIFRFLEKDEPWMLFLCYFLDTKSFGKSREWRHLQPMDKVLYCYPHQGLQGSTKTYYYALRDWLANYLGNPFVIRRMFGMHHMALGK